MRIKILLLTSIVAFVASKSSEKNNKIYSLKSHEDSSLAVPHDYYAYPKYSFDYGVKDFKTGDYKMHKEDRDGDVVKGEYTVADPDGTIRTVTYTVTKHGGFKAIVHKSGDEYQPYELEESVKEYKKSGYNDDYKKKNIAGNEVEMHKKPMAKEHHEYGYDMKKIMDENKVTEMKKKPIVGISNESDYSGYKYRYADIKKITEENDVDKMKKKKLVVGTSNQSDYFVDKHSYVDKTKKIMEQNKINKMKKNPMSRTSNKTKYSHMKKAMEENKAAQMQKKPIVQTSYKSEKSGYKISYVDPKKSIMGENGISKMNKKPMAETSDEFENWGYKHNYGNPMKKVMEENNVAGMKRPMVLSHKPKYSGYNHSNIDIMKKNMEDIKIVDTMKKFIVNKSSEQSGYKHNENKVAEMKKSTNKSYDNNYKQKYPVIKKYTDKKQTFQKPKEYIPQYQMVKYNSNSHNGGPKELQMVNRSTE